MFAICIEASHERGLGHLYRSLSLAAHFRARGEAHVVLVNDYPVAVDLLRASKTVFEVLAAPTAGWEQRLIRRLGVTTWINDRLDTDAAHAAAVKREGIRLVTFDDRGGGAAFADLHVAALCFEDAGALTGKKILTGTRYLILNREIEHYRRVRRQAREILVTLGGTDTYGVTVKVVAMLARLGRAATVVLGPGFAHLRELEAVATPAFRVKRGVPSLIEEFAAHDLAITGGGMTVFEAAATGLPCVVIANEWFEVPAARHLARLGCAIYAGHHTEIDARPLPLVEDVEAMSRAGLAQLTTQGVENVFRELAAT